MVLLKSIMHLFVLFRHQVMKKIILQNNSNKGTRFIRTSKKFKISISIFKNFSSLSRTHKIKTINEQLENLSKTYNLNKTNILSIFTLYII